MEVTFCETKAGNGFKIFVHGKWLFTKKEFLLNVIDHEANSCIFREIQKETQNTFRNEASYKLAPSHQFESPFVAYLRPEYVSGLVQKVYDDIDFQIDYLKLKPYIF